MGGGEEQRCCPHLLPRRAQHVPRRRTDVKQPHAGHSDRDTRVQLGPQSIGKATHGHLSHGHMTGSLASTRFSLSVLCLRLDTRHHICPRLVSLCLARPPESGESSQTNKVCRLPRHGQDAQGQGRGH